MKRTIAAIINPLDEGRVFLVEDVEEWIYRGEKFPIHVSYYECEDTGVQFTTTEQDERAFEELYRLYAERHNE